VRSSREGSLWRSDPDSKEGMAGRNSHPRGRENVKPLQSNSTTPRLVRTARCEGADIKRLFAMLLRQYGNVSIAEVK
jgi:hypothetical protein